ncbi:MAG: hypothetical protein K2I20_03310, partial [Clostridia bacterium]|nr:hypothetical protein [Clostridia bacterium]
NYCYNMFIDWFNYYGLAIMAVIMAPNIIYAVLKKDGYKNDYKNKPAEIFEQIGRYACIALMVFNIPYTYFNFWFEHALTVYLCVNGALCLSYLIFWIVCWNSNGMLKALSLSVIPTAIFLFSGVILAYIPLIAAAVIFGVCHILISCKNAATTNNTDEING